MTRVLFICGKNRRRSPSAEELFVGMDGVEVSSAGVGAEAVCPVSADLLEWADKVFVMEQSQKRYFERSFRAHPEGQEDCLFEYSRQVRLHAA